MKKVTVNENCFGCGYCASVCEKYFEVQDDGYSHAIKEEIEEEDIKDVQSAASGCPAGAIEISEVNESNEKAA